MEVQVDDERLQAAEGKPAGEVASDGCFSDAAFRGVDGCNVATTCFPVRPFAPDFLVVRCRASMKCGGISGFIRPTR